MVDLRPSGAALNNSILAFARDVSALQRKVNRGNKYKALRESVEDVAQKTVLVYNNNKDFLGRIFEIKSGD